MELKQSLAWPVRNGDKENLQELLFCLLDINVIDDSYLTYFYYEDAFSFNNIATA